MTNQALSLPKIAERVVDEHAAYEFLEELRWPKGPVCPHCGTVDNATFLKPRGDEAGKARATRTGAMSQRRVWKCKNKTCRKQFSVLTGTIFHGSKVPVRVWVLVVAQMCASKNGVAAREVERLYGLTPKTAWFVTHRIREAMKRGAPDLLVGTIVADETYVGGDMSNWHANDPRRTVPVRVKPGEHVAHPHKTTVLSLVNVESGEVRSQVVPNVTGSTLRKVIREQVAIESSHLQTDEGSWYNQVGKEFLSHGTVNHSVGQYVNGPVSTNRLEGYFAQLKRSLDGTHHHVSREHLPRYLAEFDFRYSTCSLSDAQRMSVLLGRADGGSPTSSAGERQSHLLLHFGR
ncbi:MAG: IS1595 family transposase [Actinomycetota bacterium]|nr:IS1595 family transposase [Actinomycetota bacterium]